MWSRREGLNIRHACFQHDIFAHYVLHRTTQRVHSTTHFIRNICVFIKTTLIQTRVYWAIFWIEFVVVSNVQRVCVCARVCSFNSVIVCECVCVDVILWRWIWIKTPFTAASSDSTATGRYGALVLCHEHHEHVLYVIETLTRAGIMCLYEMLRRIKHMHTSGLVSIQPLNKHPI